MSILKVDTIQEKTTGNGVVIPSGQTLDVSAGTLVPSAGAVVQKDFTTHGTFDSTSSSWVDVATLTFTPRFNNSRIFIHYTGQLYKYNTSNYPNSDSRIQTDLGSGGNSNLVYHPYITYMDTGQYMYSLAMSARYDVSNTNAHTVKIQIHSQGHRTYIYNNSNLFTIEEIKQ